MSFIRICTYCTKLYDEGIQTHTHTCARTKYIYVYIIYIAYLRHIQFRYFHCEFTVRITIVAHRAVLFQAVSVSCSCHASDFKCNVEFTLLHFEGTQVYTSSAPCPMIINRHDVSRMHLVVW